MNRWTLSSVCGTAAALALMTLTSACSGGEARKERFIEKGQAFMTERNYEKARLEFRNALQIDPKDVEAQILAGRAEEKLGNFNEAAGLYAAATQTDKKNVESRTELAKLFVLGGAPDRAQTLVDEALAVEPENPNALAVRAAIKLRKGDAASAREDGERAVKLAPGNENAAALMASLDVRDKRLPEGIAVVERALESNAQSLDLRVLLAQLHLLAQQPEAAERRLNEVINLDPKNVQHRYRMAQFYLLQKNVDAAEETLKRAVDAAPEDVNAKLALANLIATHRSFDAGEKSLKELIAKSKDSLALQLGLGQFYEQNRKPELAEAVYKGVVDDNALGPQGLTARNRLAGIALRRNDTAAAGKLLEEVLKESPRDNDALVMRANLALNRGDATGAITDLRAVLRDQPNSQPLLRALARAYLGNQDKTLAEESLRQAIQVNPKDIPTRLELAQLLLQNNRQDEAQPVIDELVTDQPGNVQALEAAFRVQVARRDLAGARKSAEAIRTVDPDKPLGHYLVAVVDQGENKPELAIKGFQRALEIEPDAAEPLASLAATLVSQKKVEEALAAIDATIKRNPKNALARNLRGEVLFGLGRREEAKAAFESTIGLTPAWWVPHRGVAAVELSSGTQGQERAVAAYKRGIEATKGAAPLVTDLATLLERLGRVDEAIQQYEDWLKREPRADIAANNLAMLLVTHRAAKKADLDRALELSRRFQVAENAAFLDTYGWVRYLRAEYAEAIPSLQRAVDLAPRSGLLRYHLGMAQYKAGQREAARQNLEAALAAAGSNPFEGIADARAVLAELTTASGGATSGRAAGGGAASGPPRT